MIESCGKRNAGDQAPPHDEHVCEPAQPISGKDETIAEHVGADPLNPGSRVAYSPSPPEERLPAAPPVHGRGRPLQPHGVAVSQAERGEQHGERVANEGGVEVCEFAGTDENEDQQEQRDAGAPRDRLDHLGNT